MSAGFPELSAHFQLLKPQSTWFILRDFTHIFLILTPFLTLSPEQTRLSSQKTWRRRGIHFSFFYLLPFFLGSSSFRIGDWEEGWGKRDTPSSSGPHCVYPEVSLLASQVHAHWHRSPWGAVSLRHWLNAQVSIFTAWHLAWELHGQEMLSSSWPGGTVLDVWLLGLPGH